MCPDDLHPGKTSLFPSDDAGIKRGASYAAALGQFPANALLEAPHRIRSPFEAGMPIGDAIGANGLWQDTAAYNEAVAAIEAKARQLGHADGSLLAPIAGVQSGFVGRYEGQDVYYSKATGAHEVHGDIKAKYDALLGPAGVLGLPVTDEEGTPARGGRFNHFVGGSIYWTAFTGPQAVRGGVRDVWAALGWENGLGFPVQDQYRMHQAAATDPIVEWCFFENGAIAADKREKRECTYSELTAGDLTAYLGGRLNAQFQASPDNMALRPGIAMTAVSDYRYGFWRAGQRTVSFSVQGFHDNGLWTDTDFIIDFSLGFDLVALPAKTEPATKSLVASLEFLRVRAVPGFDSLVPGLEAAIKTGVTKAIHQAFYPAVWPNPEHPEVPNGSIFIATVPTAADPPTGYIDVLGVYITAEGSLRFVLNPLTPPFQPQNETNWGHLRMTLTDTRLSPFRV